MFSKLKEYIKKIGKKHIFKFLKKKTNKTKQSLRYFFNHNFSIQSDWCKQKIAVKFETRRKTFFFQQKLSIEKLKK